RRLGEPDAQEFQLRRFEKTLLKELGYGLALDTAADTHEPIDEDSHYRYIPERGAFKVNPEEFGGLCVQGSTLLAIAKEEWPSQRELAESKRLMRAVLGHFLGGRRLHSRRIFARQRMDK
ncbi:MAG: DNA repair protein RecO C-terminal domain-containing protein, partial [Gammaproteobacteria bacterium]|nr:DNA repair protein RecO C-terminal domain-containing protein [Gammaproteobacteria bacterium]